jgi:hypothetical protein
MANLSPAPGTPQTPDKAVWGAIATALAAGLLVLWTALADDRVTNQEVVQILLAFLGAPGAVGGVVYARKNRAR